MGPPVLWKCLARPVTSLSLVQQYFGNVLAGSVTSFYGSGEDFGDCLRCRYNLSLSALDLLIWSLALPSNRSAVYLGD